MFGKEKKDELATYWSEKIKAGLDYRKKYSKEEHWDAFAEMYRGNWDKSILPINKIYSYGRMLVPRVYFNNPRIVVTASHPDLVVHSRVVEAIDNMLLRETFLKGTVKKTTLDSYLRGVGVVKLGFDSEFGYIPEQSVDENGETVTQVGKKEGYKIEYQSSVKPGMPWALRCDPKDIIVPWGSVDANNLPWIAHYIVRPLEDIKQDQKYRNTQDLKGTRTPSFGSGNSAVFRPKEEKDKEGIFGELYEIRDAKTGQVIVICENKILLQTEDVLQVEGLPYEFLMFNPDPDYFWAIPDAWILQPQQKELNLINTQISRHRAIALLKFLYLKGTITEENLNKLLSGEVGPAVEVVDVDNIAAAITTLQPHIPPDLVNNALVTMTAMQEELGFSSNEMAGFQQGTPRTATETMTVADAFQQRVSERKDLAADMVTNIVRKWNQYIFKFWSEEKVIRVVGPEGGAAWIKYTGDQLKGEYFLNVDIDSGVPITKGLKYQMGNDLMAKFGGDPLTDQVLLRQIVLETYSSVDPRIPQLLKVPPMLNPAEAGATRQPLPEGAAAGGGGGGSSGGKGGKSGSSPEIPMEFDSFRKRWGMRRK